MDGLRFACQKGCTNCCRRKGFVYLTEEDLSRAAAHLGMKPSEFERIYVYRSRRRLRLRTPRNSPCPFLLDEGCRLHPDKPTQCRLFPFWPELVEDRKAWRAEAKQCPGIGRGELIQIGTALEISAGMRSAYPESYRLSSKARR